MRAISRNAHRFMVFREGVSVSWDCTIKDLAIATGLPISSINSICNSERWKNRGWFPRLKDGMPNQRNGAQQHGVDQIITMPEGSRVRGRYEY